MRAAYQVPKQIHCTPNTEERLCSALNSKLLELFVNDFNFMYYYSSLKDVFIHF